MPFKHDEYVLAALVALFCVASSCSKKVQSLTDYNATQHDSVDAPIIRAFIQQHTVDNPFLFQGVARDATPPGDTSQLYFKIIADPNAGTTGPSIDSAVSVVYSLRILGPRFQEIVDSVALPGLRIAPLSATIPAITEACRRIHKGGRIIFIAPSSLAFRDYPTDITYNQFTGGQKLTTVPPNSILIFDLTLVSVSSPFRGAR